MYYMSARLYFIEIDQTLFHRVDHYLRAIIDMQLAINVTDMITYRFFTNSKDTRNFLGNHPPGNQYQVSISREVKPSLHWPLSAFCLLSSNCTTLLTTGTCSPL